MVYLIGRIQKIGGISGKRIYFKEIRGVALAWSLTFQKVDDDGMIYGSTHCFDCLVSLIEKALYLHNDDKAVIIKIENDLIIEMKDMEDDFLIELAKKHKGSIHFDNKIIEEIAKSVLK
jgi:hypothetical protein